MAGKAVDAVLAACRMTGRIDWLPQLLAGTRWVWWSTGHFVFLGILLQMNDGNTGRLSGGREGF